MSDTTAGNYPSGRDDLMGLIKEANRSKEQISNLWRQQARSLNRFSRALEDFSSAQVGGRGRRATSTRAATATESTMTGAHAKPIVLDNKKADTFLSEISKESKKQSATLTDIFQVLHGSEIDSKTASRQTITLMDRLGTGMKDLLRAIQSKTFGEGGILPSIPGLPKAAAGLPAKIASALPIAGPVGVVAAGAVAGGIAAYHSGKKTAEAGDLGFRAGSVDDMGNPTTFYNPDTKETLDAFEMKDRLAKSQAQIDAAEATKAATAAGNTTRPSATTGNITDNAISPQARGLLDTIGQGESHGDYSIRQGGKEHVTDFSQHPGTVAQGGVSTAAGKYQFIKGTWDEASKALGLTDFSPASQDKAAWWLAQRDYKKHTGGDLSQDVKSTDPKVQANIASALNKTWTSLPGGGDATQQGGRKQSEYLANLQQNMNKYQEGGTAGPATTPSATASAGPATTPSATGQFAIGDSIAKGIADAGKMSSMARVGANPQEILDNIMKADPSSIQGKNIVLSSGASNDPSKVALVEQQIKALQAKGAGSVKLMGVGDRKDFAGVNDKLAEISQRTGANFAGALDPKLLSADRVHPSNYAGLAADKAAAAVGNGNVPTGLEDQYSAKGASAQAMATPTGSNFNEEDIPTIDVHARDTERRAAVTPDRFLEPQMPQPAQTAQTATPAPAAAPTQDKSANPDIDSVPMYIGDNGIVYVNGGALA